MKPMKPSRRRLPRAIGPILHVLVVSPFKQPCALPNRPLIPEPRKADDQGDDECDEGDEECDTAPSRPPVRSGTAPAMRRYAPCTDNPARISRSITAALPSFSHSLTALVYLASPREGLIAEERCSFEAMSGWPNARS